MSGPLKKDGKTRLRRASRDPIVSYFQQLSAVDRQTFWLSETNRYRLNCTKQYENDLKGTTPATKVNDAALTSYIAASGPCHIIDGWSFLGRAIDSMLRGDSYGAVHLGYYAELRAAMALLACEGVGVFSRKHAVVDRRNLTHSINGSGTHAFIWPCLQYWAGLVRAKTLFDKSFRPATRTLTMWLASLGANISARVVATRWLRSWGIDLSKYEDDHDARNLVSYRPLEFRRPNSSNARDLSDFVDALWTCFEPSEGNRFPVIEKYLLRRALVAGGITFPLTEISLNALGMSTTEVASWLPVLNRENEPNFLGEADVRSTIEDSRCQLQVISRATLLLYLATSAARGHLIEAGYTREDLTFWWKSHGISRGLWDEANSPRNPLELWADVRDNLQENGDFVNSTGGFSLNSWRKGQARVVESMGAFELVAIWGLLP